MAVVSVVFWWVRFVVWCGVMFWCFGVLVFRCRFDCVLMPQVAIAVTICHLRRKKGILYYYYGGIV